MKNLLDEAYSFVKAEYQDKPFTFSQLWKNVVKRTNLNNKEAKEQIGDFFSDLLEDVRFVHLGKQKWALREYLKYEEWDAISKSMFGTKEYFEEGYENYQPENIEDEAELEISDEKDELSNISSEEEIDDADLLDNDDEAESEYIDELINEEEESE